MAMPSSTLQSGSLAGVLNGVFVAGSKRRATSSCTMSAIATPVCSSRTCSAAAARQAPLAVPRLAAGRRAFAAPASSSSKAVARSSSLVVKVREIGVEQRTAQELGWLLRRRRPDCPAPLRRRPRRTRLFPSYWLQAAAAAEAATEQRT